MSQNNALLFTKLRQCCKQTVLPLCVCLHVYACALVCVCVCVFNPKHRSQIALHEGLQWLRGVRFKDLQTSEEIKCKPHDFSLCACSVNSREALYLRDTLKTQSRMWQPSIYPCLQSQLGPGCSWQMFVLSLGPSFLHVSCFLF